MKLFSENIFIKFHIEFTIHNCYNIIIKMKERFTKMKQTKIEELNQAYNEVIKSYYDGRSTRNTRNIKQDIFISKITRVNWFNEFFSTINTQDKIVNRECISQLVKKFNSIRKTNHQINDIIYN